MTIPIHGLVTVCDSDLGRCPNPQAAVEGELLSVPMYDRLLQRIVRYHHPRLQSLEGVLASAPGPAKSRARGERSRHRQLTDACWACLLEARTSEGVVDVEVGIGLSRQGTDGVRHLGLETDHPVSCCGWAGDVLVCRGSSVHECSTWPTGSGATRTSCAA